MPTTADTEPDHQAGKGWIRSAATSEDEQHVPDSGHAAANALRIPVHNPRQPGHDRGPKNPIRTDLVLIRSNLI